MLYEVSVVIEVNYDFKSFELTVPVIVERNDETEGQWCELLLNTAVQKYTYLCGGKLPDYAHLVDYTITREGALPVEVRRPNVAIHWTADEVQGVDTNVFRQAVTEFGNQWLEENR